MKGRKEEEISREGRNGLRKGMRGWYGAISGKKRSNVGMLKKAHGGNKRLEIGWREFNILSGNWDVCS